MAPNAPIVYTLTVLSSSQITLNGSLEHNQKLLSDMTESIRNQCETLFAILAQTLRSSPLRRLNIRAKKCTANTITLMASEPINALREIITQIMKDNEISVPMEITDASGLPTSNTENASVNASTAPIGKYESVYSPRTRNTGRVYEKKIQDFEFDE